MTTVRDVDCGMVRRGLVGRMRGRAQTTRRRRIVCSVHGFGKPKPGARTRNNGYEASTSLWWEL